MRGVAVAADRSLALVELPDDPLGADEVRLAVAFCGICGSDLHMKDAPAFPVGAVMGHELAGEVVEVGDEVSGWELGDRATVFPFDPCGTCAECRAGDRHLCATGAARAVGLGGRPGGYAERVVVPARSLRRLPDRLSAAHGALTEPLAVGVHAVALAELGAGQPAVVLGGGPIGIMTAYALRLHGCERVVVVEPGRTRRELVARLGFAVADGADRDEVLALLGGEPAAVALDCSGHPSGIVSALGLVRPRGRVVVVGVPVEPSTIALAGVVIAEHQIVGSLAYSDADFDEALDHLAAGRLRADDVITTVADLAQADAWFTELTSGATEQVKVLLRP